jgi:hypothetical protein
MRLDVRSIGKAFAARIVSKAVQAFDKATMVVVVTCWSGAILVMLFALYTLSLSVTAKREAIEASAEEPSLPQMVNKAPTKAELDPLVERLQRRFSDISFALSSDMSLAVSASDGSRFRTWLTVLSYIDTISPQYRWTMREFCVGQKCGSSTLMRAVVTAEKITFLPPTPKK